MEAFADYNSHQVLPQQRSNARCGSPHWRNRFKHRGVDSCGRLSCRARIFYSQTWWTRSLYPEPDIQFSLFRVWVCPDSLSTTLRWRNYCDPFKEVPSSPRKLLSTIFNYLKIRSAALTKISSTLYICQVAVSLYLMSSSLEWL